MLLFLIYNISVNMTLFTKIPWTILKETFLACLVQRERERDAVFVGTLKISIIVNLRF